MNCFKHLPNSCHFCKLIRHFYFFSGGVIDLFPSPHPGWKWNAGTLDKQQSQLDKLRKQPLSDNQLYGWASRYFAKHQRLPITQAEVRRLIRPKTDAFEKLTVDEQRKNYFQYLPAFQLNRSMAKLSKKYEYNNWLESVLVEQIHTAFGNEDFLSHFGELGRFAQMWCLAMLTNRCVCNGAKDYDPFPEYADCPEAPVVKDGKLNVDEAHRRTLFQNRYRNMKQILKKKQQRESQYDLLMKLGNHLRKLMVKERLIPVRKRNAMLYGNQADTGKTHIILLILGIAFFLGEQCQRLLIMAVMNAAQGMHPYKPLGLYRSGIFNDFNHRTLDGGQVR